jgi:hypothetical protein
MKGETVNDNDKLSDLGDKVLHHFEFHPTCSLNAPGDYMEEDVADVDCPECLAYLENLKQRRARARG